MLFQSTPSVGRATRSSRCMPKPHMISIHALRGEGDPQPTRRYLIACHISIHALRGEGDGGIPVRRTPGTISIHALRGEGDTVSRVLSGKRAYFNPRPPWGGRRAPPSLASSISLHFNPRPPWGGRQNGAVDIRKNQRISIHALRGEGDVARLRSGGGVAISIHALRGEGDWNEEMEAADDEYFNPRPPWGGRRGVARPSPPDCRISIHALRGEGDPPWEQIFLGIKVDFNPRPPWGGRQFQTVAR